jgi:hypothetical protein
MKRILLLITATLLIINGYSQITFQKTFGGSAYGYNVHQTIDSGYIITGIDGDVFLIKTNVYGDTLWYKTYGGTTGEYGVDVQQTNDGGYIITGVNKVLLMKTNTLGDTLWSKSYGGTWGDGGKSVKQTADSGYIITGFDWDDNGLNLNVFVIKTNSIGDTTFTKKFRVTNTDNDAGYSVQQTTDGGYIICGYCGEFNIDSTLKVYLIKLQSNGDTSWTKTYGGGSGANVGYSVQQTTDGGYIIAGETNSFGAGGVDVYLIKTDSLGDTLFTKTYGGAGNETANSVQQTTDGGYIICGYTTSFGAGGADVYLIKTDNLGDTLWTRTFGGTGDDVGNSVQQTTDGGYIITGSTTSFGTSTNIYLIKTDAEGNKASPCYTNNAATIIGNTTTQVVRPPTIVGSGAIVTSPPTIIGGGDTVTTICFTVGVEELKTSNASALIYPNPNDGSFTISYHLSSLGNELLIKDIFGRTVYSSIITSQEGTQSINVSSLSNGIYYWEIVSINGIEGKGKLAVIK